MPQLHMKLGSNLGNLLLEIAQTNIKDGNPEKGINTYIDGLQGFTREYAFMLLKNLAVLVVDKDGETVSLKTDEKLLKKNQHNIFDWAHLIDNDLDHIRELREYHRFCEDKFHKVYLGDIEDYNLYEMMGRYFTSDELPKIGIHNLAAKVIAGDDFAWSKASNGSDVWFRMCDRVAHEDEDNTNDDVSNYERVLYWTTEYVNNMREIHKYYIKFDKLYHFLLENEFITRSPFIELEMELTCEYLMKFADTSKGYYHPMCNTKLYDYKEQLHTDVIHTIWGNEYAKNGILKKNILDGYDAGWISPDGEFYGLLGETAAMLHMRLAEQIFKAPCNTYAVRMAKDNVSEWSGVNSPEYWLEKHGWVKIHHDDCYGSFIGHRNEEPTTDYPYAYNPTDIQIKMICDYADKFYGGKFYTEANVFGRDRHPEPFSTYKVRQMDEFKIHEIFGR